MSDNRVTKSFRHRWKVAKATKATKVRHKREADVFGFELRHVLQWETCEHEGSFDLIVDIDVLATHLIDKAARNASGVSSMLGGAIRMIKRKDNPIGRPTYEDVPIPTGFEEVPK